MLTVTTASIMSTSTNVLMVSISNAYLLIRANSSIEWIAASRIDLTHEVEWPQPEKPEKKKTGAATKAPSKNAQKRARTDSRDVSAVPDLLTGKNVNIAKPQRPSKAGGKENVMEDIQPEADGLPKTEPDDVDMTDVGFSDTKAEE